MYKLPHELPYELRLRMWGNYKMTRKLKRQVERSVSLRPSVPSSEKVSAIVVKNYANQISNFSVPVKLCFIYLLCSMYFALGFLQKQTFACNVIQSLRNMVLSNFSQIQGLFQTFSRNTKQSQKSCKFKNFPELLFRMCSLGQKLALKN